MTISCGYRIAFAEAVATIGVTGAGCGAAGKPGEGYAG
jgi:hypothetical protein